MDGCRTNQSSLVHSLSNLLRDYGDLVLDGSSTLTLHASSLQQLTQLFEQHLLPRMQQHGFVALPSHPVDTAYLLQVQFLFDVLQKTISLKLINPPGARLQSVVKIFPFKSLKYLELKRVPPHCLEGLRGVYSQLEVFTCSKSLNSLEELLSLCGGDLSSALPWLELHTLNFSYNSIVSLDQSLSLLNVLKSLDLSHNKIEECAEFLKPLTDLEHLNLGYNCLQRAPVLSMSARAKLVTLVLRNNELETINGVEQLSSLQHMDLAYNLLLEHAQLAPLALLHCLSTLCLEGNPLYFKKSHRICTVQHLSPKAASLQFRLDGSPLSSSELWVLPKPGQHMVPAQPPPSVVMAPERSNQDGSSGAAELSDSLSVSQSGEVGVSHMPRKKNRSKVRVRRASISEPSESDYEPRPPPRAGPVLSHQLEIERMACFREQLGEDWLRYQHHLEPLSTSTPSTHSAVPSTQHLSNSLNTTPQPSSSLKQQQTPPPLAVEFPDVLPPPLLSSEPKVEPPEGHADHDTELTLEWQCQSRGLNDSTLDKSTLDNQMDNQGPESPSGHSPDSETMARRDSCSTKEEDEELDLGVDLCAPLLVGLLSEEEEDDNKVSVKGKRTEVFLCVKQGLLLEVDMQRGRERCRLELDSLSQVDTSEAAWTQGETETILPALELQFQYISKEKKRRRYVLLDDDPRQALEALQEMLSRAVEENQRRNAEAQQPDQSWFQCLRCSLEFTLSGDRDDEEVGGRVRRRGVSVLQEGAEEELDLEYLTMVRDEGDKGNSTICPQCGCDHVVQLAGCAPRHSNMTSGKDRDSSLSSLAQDFTDASQTHPNIKDSNTDISISSSPTLDATITAEDTALSFATAQESSFFIGESDSDTPANHSLANSHSKEELAGSYSYGATLPASHFQILQQQHTGRDLTCEDDLDLMSEDCDVVDHRLKLFLDVEVFEEEEEVRCLLQMSSVKFGEPGEVPALLVVSNLRIYFLELMSEMHSGPPSDWLQKRDSRLILELSYLEVGLGSQSIHLEFAEGGPSYTLLVRDSARCKHFFGLLTGMVREMATKANSQLRSISTSRLTPEHRLWPLVNEDEPADMEDGQLQFFYLLALLLQEDVWTPLTVLATRETLYLLDEDHQWRKSSENGPCGGSVTVVENQPISCMSSVHLWTADACRMDIKLYDETMKQEKTWCVRSGSEELLQALLAWVTTQWEAMFGVKLCTTLQDA